METASYIDKLAYTAGQESDRENYWINQFSGELVKSGFPYDHKKIDTNKRFMETYSFKLTHDYYSQLMKLSNGSLLRLHMLLIAGIVSLLFKYSGNNDIIVGTSIYKQDIQGEFINTVLALLHHLEGNMTFKQLVLQVRATIAGAVENQNFPIELILEKSGIPFGKDDDFPLFDIAVLLENIQERTYIRHINPTMSFFFTETGEAVEAVVEYNLSLYKRETIERLMTHFKHLLHQVLFNFELQLAQINILTQEEKKRLLIEFNHTDAVYPKDLTITELFQQQAEKTPHHIAAIHENCQVSYNRLNRRSNQLASILREKEVKTDSIVALMAGPSLDLVTGILGILKTGAAYLPLDPGNPETRTRYILNDSSASVILTQQRFNENISKLAPNLTGRIVFLDEHSIYADPVEPNSHQREIHHQPKHMAYIIYTSGTTGRPKGVIIDHRGLVNYICWAAHRYVKNERVNFPLFTSISFDLTITSIFTPLITGNAIVVYGEEEVYDPLLIEKIIDQNRVEMVKLTPSHLRLIRQKPLHSSAIRRYLVGGEELDTQLAAEISENSNHNIEIYNEYGPTETVVGCMCYRYNPKTDTRPSVPIGEPIDNMQVFILDANGSPLPPGTVGELCISGHGMARGYLNNPELTAKKFKRAVNSQLSFVIGSAKSSPKTNDRCLMTNDSSNKFFPNDHSPHYPISPLPHHPMYLSGDLARWLTDGNIEFLGRMDHQVKIRGYRIELSEIESQLKKHPNIKEVVITADGKNSEDRYLCAYVVTGRSNPGAAPELIGTELQEYLAQKLPDYMIPTYFLNLEKLPLTTNGKINRKALPEPEKVLKKNKYTAPRNREEEKLVEIWSEILAIEKQTIGIDDNFFQLGGHSLRATIAVPRIHKELNIKLSLAEFFKHPTIREVSQYRHQFPEVSMKEKYEAIPTLEKREYYELSSAQKRLYILQQMDLQGKNYNIPGVFIFEGKLAREKFEKAFQVIIRHQEAFRTSFCLVHGEPVQKIEDGIEFRVNYKKIPIRDQEEIKNLAKDFVTPFDLSQAPLLRVELIQWGKEKYLIFYDMHHIISDGISMQLLQDEFAALYQGKHQQPLRIHYKDYANWQNRQEEGEEFKRMERYWLEKMKDFHFTQFPYHGNNLNSYRQARGEREELVIHRELYEEIHRFVGTYQITKSTFIMTIFNIITSLEINQEDITIGIPFVNREHYDLENIIGIFLNVLLIRTIIKPGNTLLEVLEKTNQNIIAAMNNSAYPYEVLDEKIREINHLKTSELFTILFNYFQPEKLKYSLEEFTIKPVETRTTSPKYDLTLYVSDTGEEMGLSLVYKTNILDSFRAKRMMKNFYQLIHTILENEHLKITAINMEDDSYTDNFRLDLDEAFENEDLL